MVRVKQLIGIVAFVLITIVGIIVGPQSGLSASAAAQDEDTALLQALDRASEGAARISYHAETGKVRFIGTAPEQPLTVASLDGSSEHRSPQAAARAFLSRYGSLFGLKDQAGELSVIKEQVLDDGRAFVRFQQQYQEIPVFGGELVVQLNGRGETLSANGEILPDVELSTLPDLDAASARQIAVAKVAKYYNLDPDELGASEPELWVYDPALLDAPGRRFTALVWRMDVAPDSLSPIRELVLVDAHSGLVVTHFNQIHDAKNRLTYDAGNGSTLPGALARSEGAGATGDADVDAAHDYAGDTYDFFASEHGRDSLDGAGMNLISTTHYCPSPAECPYQNAFWNGQQMVYGETFSQADDVVAHELTHGVTDFSSHLFYYYQSGAINESLSDIWGEIIDLTNGAGNDSSGARWLLGEDLPGIGAIRDMQHPPNFNDPDRIGSFLYHCAASDSGGVHINSGVNNKAAYLMVDGDTFNGFTVNGLGPSKVADLYYEVQTNMLTSGSNYQDLYDALLQAARNLNFSASDQQQVANALDAVEMSERPCSGPEEAPLCPAGQGIANTFFDDMENTASGNWVSMASQGPNTWYYPQNTHPIPGFDATYSSSGVYNLWGYNQPNEADFHIRMSDNVTIPADGYMHFKHSYGFESGGWDGGIVEYSVNNGAWNSAGSLFVDGGYNGTISSSFGNPLGGSDAFINASHGYTSSRLDLSGLSGDNVRFRFRIGTDSSFDDYGWFIDDVRIYSCGTGPLPPEGLYLPLIQK